MATKAKPGAFDCYAAARKHEPMFILLGRDKHAPLLVRMWALVREAANEDPAKVAEARECADAMEGWLEAQGKEVNVDILVDLLETHAALQAYARKMGDAGVKDDAFTYAQNRLHQFLVALGVEPPVRFDSREG